MPLTISTPYSIDAGVWHHMYDSLPDPAPVTMAVLPETEKDVDDATAAIEGHWVTKQVERRILKTQ